MAFPWLSLGTGDIGRRVLSRVSAWPPGISDTRLCLVRDLCLQGFLATSGLLRACHSLAVLWALMAEMPLPLSPNPAKS